MSSSDQTHVAPVGQLTKVTVKLRGQVVLIGINRPHVHNRIDPEAFRALAKAYFEFEHDPLLRAAVLFAHGDNFSQGVDVDAFTELAKAGSPTAVSLGMIDPLGKSQGLSKPLIAVVHGDTWNMGHELFLAADIRVASSNVRFGQDENTDGRFPGGGSTVRFVREVGWSNAMRYMLTGDHWGAEEAYRMGLVQHIALDPPSALEAGLIMASKIVRCGPLGIKSTLSSAHLAIDASEEAAFSKLDEQYGALYRTKDFIEGRDAEAAGRPAEYQGI